MKLVPKCLHWKKPCRHRNIIEASMRIVDCAKSLGNDVFEPSAKCLYIVFCPSRQRSQISVKDACLGIVKTPACLALVIFRHITCGRKCSGDQKTLERHGLNAIDQRAVRFASTCRRRQLVSRDFLIQPASTFPFSQFEYMLQIIKPTLGRGGCRRQLVIDLANGSHLGHDD